MMPLCTLMLVLHQVITASASGAYEDWYPYHDKWWSGGVGTASNIICEDGKMQSPVNFPRCENAMTRPAPTLTWPTDASVELTNNGHTVQVGVERNDSQYMAFTIGGVNSKYTLLQCHFHFGSEHTYGGHQYPFETHCVHILQKETGTEGDQYGVMGVFWEVDNAKPPNDFLAQIENELPTHSSSNSKRRLAAANFSTYTGPFNFLLLAKDVDGTRYFTYQGSFTTPPCTEVASFFIFKNHKTLTDSQLTLFKTAIGWENAGGNFRPPQQLMKRTIYGCLQGEPTLKNLDWYPYRHGQHWKDAVGSKSHAVCGEGSQQSPINFRGCATPVDRTAISISWSQQNADLINNGHTVVLGVDTSASGTMNAGGKTYNLMQCHFHWASEHTVQNQQYPFESHCVHQQDGTDESPHYGVFGLFFNIGADNEFLDSMGDLPVYTPSRRLKGSFPSALALDTFGFPMDAGTQRRLAGNAVSKSVGPLDFKSLYGSNTLTRYWDYTGSFTTPPCTEAVDFYIMMDPATLGVAQLDKFKAAIGWIRAGGNFRPPQPLGSRVVSGCLLVIDDGHLAKEAVKDISSDVMALIDAEIKTHIESALEEHRGSGMYTVVIVLAVLVVLLAIVTLGAVSVLLKKVRNT